MIPSTQTDQQLHDEAAEAYRRITRQLGKRSFRQQKKALDAWLARYLPLARARGLEDGVIAMRRNALRWLLTEAAEAKRPLPAIKRLLHDLETIGWEDLFYKSLTLGALCAYLADRMWNREGLRYLLPVKRAMQAEYARTGAEMWVLALKSYDHLERRLRSRKRSR